MYTSQFKITHKFGVIERTNLTFNKKNESYIGIGYASTNIRPNKGDKLLDLQSMEEYEISHVDYSNKVATLTLNKGVVGLIKFN